MSDEQPIEELPEEAGEVAEVAIDFVPDDFGLKVTAVLGNASIIVEHDWEDGPENAATLVQALPNILIAVQTALDEQEPQE